MLARSVAASDGLRFEFITRPRSVFVALVPIVLRAMDHPKVVENADVLSILPKNNWFKSIVPYMTFHPTTLS